MTVLAVVVAGAVAVSARMGQRVVEAGEAQKHTDPPRGVMRLEVASSVRDA